MKHEILADDGGLMLVHRLRRWPNIETALVQRLVLAGVFVRYFVMKHEILADDGGLMLVHRLRRWPNIEPPSCRRLVWCGNKECIR